MKRAAMYACLLVSILSVSISASADDDWLTAASTSRIQTYDGDQPLRRSRDDQGRRGYVTIRRINPQGPSDWDNDQTALPYLIYQLRMRTHGEFPAYVNNDGISLLGDEIFDYPVIYFTSHYAFDFTEDEVENLKKYLARGGSLMLDDCTGSGPFMDSVVPNVQRIAPGAELKPMLRETKEFFDLFNIIYEMKRMPLLKEQFMQPFQAVYINGRPAITICPNDYGCGWEVGTPPTATNPLGGPAHGSGQGTPTGQRGREETYQFSINWLFYVLTH